jgi:hypothetical protein
MEYVGIFCGHLVHFTVFCYILRTFGKVCGNLVHFYPFWYFVPRKIWQPCFRKPSRTINSDFSLCRSELSFLDWFTYKAKVQLLQELLFNNKFMTGCVSHHDQPWTCALQNRGNPVSKLPPLDLTKMSQPFLLLLLPSMLI